MLVLILPHKIAQLHFVMYKNTVTRQCNNVCVYCSLMSLDFACCRQMGGRERGKDLGKDRGKISTHILIQDYFGGFVMVWAGISATARQN